MGSPGGNAQAQPVPSPVFKGNPHGWRKTLPMSPCGARANSVSVCLFWPGPPQRPGLLLPHATPQPSRPSSGRHRPMPLIVSPTGQLVGTRGAQQRYCWRVDTEK